MPEELRFKSQPFCRRYESNLPTSLTYITLIVQGLLTLGTWCGFWYGFLTITDAETPERRWWFSQQTERRRHSSKENYLGTAQLNLIVELQSLTGPHVNPKTHGGTVLKKRKLFRALPSQFHHRHALPPCSNSTKSSGILTWFPFKGLWRFLRLLRTDSPLHVCQFQGNLPRHGLECNANPAKDRR